MGELAMNYVAMQGLRTESELPYQGRDGKCQKSNGGALVDLFGTASSAGSDSREIIKAKSAGKEESLEDLVKPGVHLTQLGAVGRFIGMHGWERLPENKYLPLLHAVVDHGPVGVSVAASDWSMYSSGIFNGCSKDAVIDHAVTLVGY